MAIDRFRTRSVWIVLALLPFLAVLGCRGTGLDRVGPKTATGAVGGAAAGGLLGAALGDGEAIAAGAILGGLLGAGVGNVLDQRDRRYMADTTYDALEHAPTGEARTWRNPDTGHYGQVTPVETYASAEGRNCREFRQSVTIDGEQEYATGTACRRPDGTWQIVQ